MTRPKARCGVCHLTYSLRQDGTVRKHPALWEYGTCEGSGKPPRPAEQFTLW